MEELNENRELETESTRPERSLFLALLLTFFTLSITLRLLGIVVSFFKAEVIVNDSISTSIVTGVFYLISLIGLAGIWNWKKWAVYFYVIFSILIILLSILGSFDTMHFIVGIGSMIWLGLLVWAISKEWNQFQ